MLTTDCVPRVKRGLGKTRIARYFFAGFAPIAAEIVYIDAGAPYPSNPRLTDYQKLNRAIWPRVEDPHGNAAA